MAHGIADVERIIRSLLTAHFGEHGLPMPVIKLVNRIGAKYLARCSWPPGTDNTIFEIQRSALNDERTLRRVIAHELIHHWDFLRNDQTKARALARMGIKEDGHGPVFEGYAARINALEGADYVTAKSDQSYDTSKAPPYYILVEPHGTRYGYTIAIRPSASQKAEIAKRQQTRLAKLFKTTDGRFLNGTPIGRSGFSLPRANPEHDEALRTLYLTGTPV